MNNREYHSKTSHVSKSGLDWVNKSPLHYYANYLDPDREPRKNTAAQIIGSAVHKAILEPNDFSNEYMLAPEVNKRTTVGRDEYAEFEKRYSGKELISIEIYDTIMRMRDSVMRHPAAMSILSDGIAEQSLFWVDPLTGANCKCRPDWQTRSRIIADVKSTEDASPEGFGRSAAKYRYHVQGALYLDGYESINYQKAEGFVFIAVEKTPPYAVALYFLRPQDYELGRLEYQANLRTYQQCVITNHWPGYNEQITNLQLPAYAFHQKNL